MNAAARGIYRRACRAPVRQAVSDIDLDALLSQRIAAAPAAAIEGPPNDRDRALALKPGARP